MIVRILCKNDNLTFLICKNNISENYNDIYYTDINKFIIKEFKFTDIKNNYIEIKQEKSDLDKWKESALKLDFLIKELKRFGIEKNDNYASIVDLHRPYYS